jgi:undecaprenyl-diphosphatase
MPWDVQLLTLLNQTLACPLLDDLMAVISLVSIPVVMIPFLFGISWFKKREGTALLGIFVLSTLLAVGMQLLLGRARPAGVRLVEPLPPFPSFPSGHAAGAFALATLTALFWPRRRWLPFSGAVLVAYSRVYLGQHYPSDVLAGAILGMATAATVYGFFYAPADPGRPRWSWLLWGQAAVVLLATLGASLGLLHFGFLARPGADKALHFALFGLLAFLAVGWWAQRPAWQVVVPLALLALAEELSQRLIPGRSTDPLDLAAALAGMVLFAWLGRRAEGQRWPYLHCRGACDIIPPARGIVRKVGGG